MCRPHTQFVRSGQQPQLQVGKESDGAGGEGGGGELSQTLKRREGASSRPSLAPILLGAPGGDWSRRVGDGPWLEGEMPLKAVVPVGSRDERSAVHWQLSAEHRPPPNPAPPPATTPGPSSTRAHAQGRGWGLGSGWSLHTHTHTPPETKSKARSEIPQPPVPTSEFGPNA